MTRTVTIISAFIALTLLMPPAVHAADGTFDISVKADSTKANGSLWD